jgi:hypothetical protein
MTTLDISKLSECLHELGDKEFQQRTWLESQGPEVSSFSELVSQAFDDTGLSDVLDTDSLEMEVSAEAAFALKELSKAINNVDPALSPAALIEHPTMEKVRVCARRAVSHLEKGKGVSH